jgi:phage-related protein
MGVNYLYYGGKVSTDFGIRVERWPDYYVPSRVVSEITVPGRNGDLIQDTGAYSNFDKSYDLYFNAKGNGFHDMARAITTWLCSDGGYRRLEDSYDPDVFLMARVSNQEMLRNWMNMYGRTTVTFNCKPQRFLKIGEEEMSLTSGEDIFNAWMPCYPIFKLTGNGTLNVNGNTIGISNNLNKTIVIDCDTQNAYTGTENRNGDIYVTGEFPFLVSGENEITFNNTCSMIPRWWTL